MSTLFDSAQIGTLTLRNRFIRSATWEGMATEDGATTKKLNSLMGTLAKNELGLIITGHAFVAQQGKAHPWQLGVHTDTMVPGLKEMADAVHAKGGAICLQLAHGGFQADEKQSGQTLVGPSSTDTRGGLRGRELSVDEIHAVVNNFALAATRAKTAGFDAVQIHAAHGFLISEFLSPFFNLRTDEYGGSRENRERLLMEVYAAVRAAVGADFPVLVKINAHDYIMGDNPCYKDEDMLSVCARLEAEGIDAIELSGGTKASGKYKPVRMGVVPESREGYYRKPAERYKEKIGVPLILVGGIRSLEKAEAFVDEGICDFISLSRPLIREPNLVKRWKDGKREKSQCLSDNMCFKPILAGEGMYCVLKKKQLERKKQG